MWPAALRIEVSMPIQTHWLYAAQPASNSREAMWRITRKTAGARASLRTSREQSGASRSKLDKSRSFRVQKMFFLGEKWPGWPTRNKGIFRVGLSRYRYCLGPWGYIAFKVCCNTPFRTFFAHHILVVDICAMWQLSSDNSKPRQQWSQRTLQISPNRCTTRGQVSIAQPLRQYHSFVPP